MRSWRLEPPQHWPCSCLIHMGLMAVERRWLRMAAVESFDETHLERMCGVLGHTSRGLSGSEIGHILQQLGIADDNPTITKRIRLFYALANRQRSDCYGNIVVKFIYVA